MAELSIEFECRCTECDATLDSDTHTDHRGKRWVLVKPCATCTEAARDEGRDEAAGAAQ